MSSRALRVGVPPTAADGCSASASSSADALCIDSSTQGIRSVTGLDRLAPRGHVLVALPKAAVEQIQHVSEALARELGVVAVALVAGERMLAVHLHPREAGSGVLERGVNGLAALTRDVRILAAPDHQQLAAKLPDPVERVVIHTLPETALVDIGGVEAGRCPDIGIEGGTEGKMTTDADPDRPELAGARGVVGEKVQGGTGVRVVGSKLFSDLVGVAPLGARCVVGEDANSTLLQLLEDLRHRNDVAVAGKKGGGPADGTGHLEDLGEQHEPWVAPRGRGAQEVGAHRAVGRFKVDVFLRGDDHSVTIIDVPPGTRAPAC